MAVYSYDGKEPQLGLGCYISDSARVIGDVVLGENCWVGHNAVVRADHGQIVLYRGVAVEENVVIHVRHDSQCILEDRVTLGHGAIVHCDHIGSHAVVGMGAVVGRQATVGAWAIVAEGAVVTRGLQVEEGVIMGGVPAKVVGRVSQEHKKYWQWAKDQYEAFAQEYARKLVRLY